MGFKKKFTDGKKVLVKTEDDSINAEMLATLKLVLERLDIGYDADPMVDAVKAVVNKAAGVR
jgi:hypothetical protein